MSEHCHSSRCSALHSGSTQNQNFPSSLSCVLTLLEASLVVKASHTEWTTTRCITLFRLTVNFILLSQLSVSLSMVDVSDAVAGRQGWGGGRRFRLLRSPYRMEMVWLGCSAGNSLRLWATDSGLQKKQFSQQAAIRIYRYMPCCVSEKGNILHNINTTYPLNCN